jgi:hypothetical protein
MTKLSADEQREIIPDDSVHIAFMRREDILSMATPEERERAWQEHLRKLNELRETLSRLDWIIL